MLSRLRCAHQLAADRTSTKHLPVSPYSYFALLYLEKQRVILRSHKVKIEYVLPRLHRPRGLHQPINHHHPWDFGLPKHEYQD
jgi:hypothetical protein